MNIGPLLSSGYLRYQYWRIAIYGIVADFITALGTRASRNVNTIHIAADFVSFDNVAAACAD